MSPLAAKRGGNDEAGDPLLSARDLRLERGGRELFRDLSFSVSPGELWQIEGPNGAGKTSLLRVLGGLSRYGFEGDVRRSAPLLYLGHLSAVKALLTPRENLAWHPSGEGDHPGERIDAALGSLGLGGFEDVPSHTLSAGQQRRVNLARLYLSRAPLWLLDEPFTAIDRAGVAALETLILRHVESGGGVVLTSHQPLTIRREILRLSLQGGAAP